MLLSLSYIILITKKKNIIAKKKGKNYLLSKNIFQLKTKVQNTKKKEKLKKSFVTVIKFWMKEKTLLFKELRNRIFSYTVSMLISSR